MTSSSRLPFVRPLLLLALVAALQTSAGCTKKSASSKNEGPQKRARPAGMASDSQETAQARSGRPVAGMAPASRAARSPAPRPAGLPPSASAGDFSSRQVTLYRLDLMGKAVGSLTQQQTVWSDRIETLEHADISMTRGAASIRIKILSRTLEKPDGTPIAFAVSMDQGPVKISSKGELKNGKLIIRDQSGTREVPYDRKWLFPAASERKILDAGFSKGTKVEFFQFDPLMGMTGKKVLVEMLGPDKTTWQGKPVTCHRVRMTVGGLSPSTACVDDHNIAYRATMSFGAISLNLTLVKKIRSTPHKRPASGSKGATGKFARTPAR